MGEALLTRRGSGGGTIKNGIAKSVFPVEDIRQNMFVEQVSSQSLVESKTYYSNIATYDGENFLCSTSTSLYFLSKNKQGVYEYSDAINIGFETTIGSIFFLNSRTAIITTVVGGSEKPAYWYIFEIDFSLKTITQKYKSTKFAGQWGNTMTNTGVRFQAISQNRFLLMFLTESSVDYTGSEIYCLTLFSIDSSWKLKVEKNFFANSSGYTGYLRSYSLGKFDDGEDEKGKYGLYWAQFDYYEKEYNYDFESLKICSRISLKVYYDTGEFEELYKITSKGSSMPPGLTGQPIVIKNTLVYLGSNEVSVIKFGPDHIPVSSSPMRLTLAPGDIKSGAGSKITMAYRGNSLFQDELYFIYIQSIKDINYYGIGKIVPTEDLVTYEFAYLIGDSVTLANEITDGFFSYSETNAVFGLRKGVIKQEAYNHRYARHLYLDCPMVKQAENLIFGVSGIKELKKNEVGTVYSI